MKRIIDMLESVRSEKASGRASLKYKYYKLLVNLFYPFGGIEKKDIIINNNVIVSLTSYGDRVKYVWKTIYSIINQTVKADKIILWLAEDEFKNGEKDLPKKLLKLKKEGLEIRFCEDIRSHKKYYYSVQEYKDKAIITIDDDMIYPETLVEELVRLSKDNPGCICCTYAQRITIDENNNWKAYKEWPDDIEPCIKPDLSLVPIGCGGVLYPAGCFEGTDLLNKELIRKYCYSVDDLWLKINSLRKEIPVVRIKKKFVIYFSIMASQKLRLSIENNHDGKNDEAIKQLKELYPEIVGILET